MNKICDKFLDILAKEIEDRTDDERQFLKEHSGSCKRCEAILLHFQRIEDSASANLTTPSEGFTETVMNKLRPHLKKAYQPVEEMGFLEYLFSDLLQPIILLGSVITGIVSIVLLLIYRPHLSVNIDLNFLNYIPDISFSTDSLIGFFTPTVNLIIGGIALSGSLLFTWRLQKETDTYQLYRKIIGR
jgi:hypothetical protein